MTFNENQNLLEQDPIIDLTSLEWSKDRPVAFDSLPFIPEPGFDPSMLKGNELVSTDYAYKKVNVGGYMCDLAGRDDILRIQDHDRRSVNIYLSREKGWCELTFEIDESEDSIVTETTIVRRDENRSLPRSTGMILFKGTFEMCQKLSDQKNKLVIHRIDKSPGYGGVPMSSENWDKVFLPILTKAEYMRSSEYSYYKEYYPAVVDNN